MSAVTDVKPLRWSSARDCARKAVFEAVGAPARERTEKEERVLHRGRTIGREFLVMLATASGKKINVASGPDWWVPPHLLTTDRGEAGLIAEQPVRWALGTGHADGFVTETGTIIEVLSSAHASDEMIRSKLLQAVGYAEHFEASRNVALVIVNPADFSEDRVVVVKTSQAYRDLVEEMRERLAQLDQWRATGAPPARVCSKPSESRGHFCLYAEHCFEGWQPPTLEQIAASPELVAAVAGFATTKAAQARAEKEAKAYESQKKEHQQVIEAAELPAGQAVQIGGYVVKRSAVQRASTFDWKAAEAAGRFSLDALSEFLKPGAGYSTFKADKLDGYVEAPNGDEEVPF